MTWLIKWIRGVVYAAECDGVWMNGFALMLMLMLIPFKVERGCGDGQRLGKSRYKEEREMR